MGCSDSRAIARASSAGRKTSSVLVLDLCQGMDVTTTSSGTDFEMIPLTFEDVEDLAAHIEDLVVTVNLTGAETLKWKVFVQQRTLDSSWETPSTPSPDVIAETTDTGLTVSTPYTQRQNFGRKFRLVLGIVASTGSFGKGTFTISAAPRLFC